MTHVNAARTRRIAITTPTMRPIDTLDFAGAELAAGEEDGAGDLVLLARRVEVVVELDKLEDGEGVVDVSTVEAGVGETMIVEGANVVAESPVLDVGCDVSWDVVASPELLFDFFPWPWSPRLDAGPGGGARLGEGVGADLSRRGLKTGRSEEGCSGECGRKAWLRLLRCAL